MQATRKDQAKPCLRPVCLRLLFLAVISIFLLFRSLPGADPWETPDEGSIVLAKYETPIPHDLVCHTSTDGDDSTTSTTTTTTLVDGKNAMHVLFGLSGDDPGFLAEFQVALKSVLLNAPLDTALTVHVVADQHDAVQLVLEQTGVMDWQVRQRTAIRLYRVRSDTIQRWTNTIQATLGPLTGLFPSWKSVPMFRHSVGQYFRLFAHDILSTQSDVDHVVYLDTDVVIMSNLNHLWRQRQERYWFQWGANMVSACMLINVSRLNELWKLYQSVDVHKVKSIMEDTLDRHIADDQMILQVLNITNPQVVGYLDPAWDVSYVDGPWNKPKNQLNEPVLPRYRSAVGMLHYNGGGSSKEAYMVKHEVFRKKKSALRCFMLWPFGGCQQQKNLSSSWGLAQYYIDLPWSQARFIAESQVQDECYTVQFFIDDV
eukprot:scaffold7467_cov187-Amphora_coffeaeformis.AAC.3